MRSCFKSRLSLNPLWLGSDKHFSSPTGSNLLSLLCRTMRLGYIIGESNSGSFSVRPSSPSMAGGGGGGRREASVAGLRRSGGRGSTRAGWRRRREALNPSQASLSPPAVAWTKGELFEMWFLLISPWGSRRESLTLTRSCLLASASAAALCWNSTGKLSSSLTANEMLAENYAGSSPLNQKPTVLPFLYHSTPTKIFINSLTYMSTLSTLMPQRHTTE